MNPHHYLSSIKIINLEKKYIIVDKKRKMLLLKMSTFMKVTKAQPKKLLFQLKFVKIKIR